MMNIRDEIDAMGLNEKQAVIHLADEIDQLGDRVSVQHAELRKEICGTRADLKGFRAEVYQEIGKNRALTLRAIFIMVGVIVTVAVDVVLSVTG